MSSPSSTPLSGAEDAETPTQKQARLRRERREAKIKAGGTSRLERITQVSGRQNLPDPSPLAPAPSSTPDNNNDDNDNDTTPDPPEIDLSTHPSAQYAQLSEPQLRALLHSSGPQNPPTPPEESDPLTALLTQLTGADPNSQDSPLPPGLASLLSGMNGPQTQSGQGRGQEEDRYGYLWPLVHFICALGLALYVVMTSSAALLSSPVASNSSMGGTERPIASTSSADGAMRLFPLFITAELLLQGTKYFLESSGRIAVAKQAGLLGWICGVVPEPWGGWVRLAVRYRAIWVRVVEDAGVVVFVLGVVSWWGGGAL